MIAFICWGVYYNLVLFFLIIYFQYSLFYADDFIITANTKEIAEELKETVSQFLKERGLTLSEEKTIITHIDEGFDFLGWTFKKYKEKLIVKPSKNSIKTMIRKCSTIILKEMKARTQSELIRRLNQIIRGLTNYHKHVVASHTFSYSRLEWWLSMTGQVAQSIPEYSSIFCRRAHLTYPEYFFVYFYTWCLYS